MKGGINMTLVSIDVYSYNDNAYHPQIFNLDNIIRIYRDGKLIIAETTTAVSELRGSCNYFKPYRITIKKCDSEDEAKQQLKLIYDKLESFNYVI